MATIILGAAGAALGGAIGGTALGLSSAVIGRAIGATLGRAIDQRIMGGGSDVVETGRVDRFRLTGAGEGAPIANVYGQMRVSGQVIWATRFKETVSTSGGGSGKGAPRQPTVRSYTYSVSLAMALCEGEITRVGRIWADGVEVERDQLNIRVYTGSETQLPDPKMEAVEGVGNVPAYRGVAYVVIEDLQLGPYGNRVPQLTFEVLRPDMNAEAPESTLALGLKGVSLVPGTGEYGLATTPVHYQDNLGTNRTANMNAPSGKTDFETSIAALVEELPGVGSASLVVSWFGDDLRCGNCTLRPKVEQADADGHGMPWNVSGISRGAAALIPKQDGKSVYGGTPTDQSVIEAIQHLKAEGKDVTFYPFILMDQIAGNSLINPWTGTVEQPALPWRGRITTSRAPGIDGSPDGTAFADAEVAQFFGSASAADFSVGTISGAPLPVIGSTTPGAARTNIQITYSGAPEWSYRRFILHYAHLCVAAGGVEAFCIGSEMRALTQIRGENNSFPAVAAMISLLAEVRAILGPGTKISYAADWSEYFGYHPQDGSGDVFFHLDPLWSDSNIDFIGIDNYMPLSDWREGQDHKDASWESIYNRAYLKSGIAGGEGYDWFYSSDEARDAQIRTPIDDSAHGEDWVFRYKDLKGWWENFHHNRIGGVRDENPTGWSPESKPFRFTEYGCAAIDKGANQPNRFLDPKSSESGLPHFSSGSRDELMQHVYALAMQEYWADPVNNPVSDTTGQRLVDFDHAHIWAWDTRPFPHFPNNADLWSDSENYARGHWLNGRAGARTLASTVRDICLRAGVSEFDTSRLFGFLRGYMVEGDQDARAALQPLMLAYGFDAVERNGKLIFADRDGLLDFEIDGNALAIAEEQAGDLELIRAPVAEISGIVRLNYVQAGADYETRSAEAIFPDETSYSISQSELAMALLPSEGQAIVERWLAEARIARDRIKFALPPSQLRIGAGDVVQIAAPDIETSHFRIDQVEQAGAQLIEATRVEPGVYVPADRPDEALGLRPFTPAVPILPIFMDLPIIRETEAPHAPYIAATANPWPGSAAVYSSPTGSDYALNRLVGQSATFGVTRNALPAAPAGLKDNGVPLRVELSDGELNSALWSAVLSGANLAAIGDGTADQWELFQFETADLIAPGVYDLSGRLRGQLGTDALIPANWPSESKFVLLNSALVQLDMPLSARGLARYYRVGTATRAFDDPSYTEAVAAFDGVGLRPYSPTHLRVSPDGSGGYDLGWIRRTRIDGDSWASFEVPLGEDIELYNLRVLNSGGSILRDTLSVTPNWTYTAAMIAADGQSGATVIEVRQVSQTFGPGLAARVEFTI